MPSRFDPSLGRRAFLVGAAAGAGWLVTRGLGASGLLERSGAPVRSAAIVRALGATLTPRQRELIVLPADHPSRQITNTLTVLERPHLGTLLSPAQRALAEALYRSMLSPEGEAAFAGTLAVEGRLDGAVLAIYGEPAQPDVAAVIMGGHLMLRSGPGPGGAAFGGGTAYGHQIGNRRWRVPGNSFAPHGDAANRLYAALSPEQKQRAVQPKPPHELVLQVQGERGSFAGVRFDRLGDAAQQAARSLVDTVFASYPEEERARARDCLEANGGLGALHFACYASHGFYEDMTSWDSLDPAERARRSEPYWQVWRMEGPGAVLHFQGHPHVHAYVHVVREPERTNLGETLAETRSTLQGEALRRLLEAALRRATGEALAFYPESVPARFCAGAITTGLAYALDPYANHVAVATIEGRAMGEPLRARLAAQGVGVEAARRYRIASAEYFAQGGEGFGEAERVERSPQILGDALVAHLRAGGLADAAA
jgi:hypothetical protein